MDKLMMQLTELAATLGIGTCRELDPRLLIPEQRIRDLCHEDKCGNYGKNYMCPPGVGSLEDTANKLKGFQRGVLLRYSRPLKLRGDRGEATQAKIDFHGKILKLEGFLKGEGMSQVWGMIGGSCELCEGCKAKGSEPCLYPDQARTSMEAIGVDVLALLARFGLDTEFRPDRITWTGCILF